MSGAMGARAQAARGLLALAMLLAGPAGPAGAAGEDGPRCREGTECVFNSKLSSNEYSFKVKGWDLNVVNDEGQKKYTVKCNEGRGGELEPLAADDELDSLSADDELDDELEPPTADDPALPALPAPTAYTVVELHGCRPPASSYADALRALNITVTRELRLMFQPAAPSLTRQHVAGLNVTKFMLHVESDDDPMRPAPDFLAELPRLEDLSLSMVESPRALLRLPATLRSLVLNEAGLLAAERELSASPDPAERAAATRWLANLTALQTVSLIEQYTVAESESERLTAPPLASLTHLTSANIRLPLKQLPERWLVGSKLTTLQLVSCAISNLSSLPFEGSNLTTLIISSNNLSDLPKGVFQSLHALEELDVSDNKLSREALLDRALPPLRALRVLRASGNPLGSLCGGGTPSNFRGREATEKELPLRRLELRKTYATRICSDWLTATALATIDLGDNNIDSLEFNELVMMRDASASTVHLNLENNPLRDVAVTQTELDACQADATREADNPNDARRVRVELSVSALNCNCHNARLRALVAACPLLTLAEGNKLANCSPDPLRPPEEPSKFMDHEPDQLLCRFNDSCVPGCSCGKWRLSDNATVVQCRGALGPTPRWPPTSPWQPLALVVPRTGLVRVPQLHHLRELHAAYNNITELNENDIPKSLRELDLSNNSIARVSAAAAERLRGVNVSLAGNPFACVCGNQLAFIKLKDANVRDWDELQCGGEGPFSGRLLKGLHPDELCSSLLPWLAVGGAAVVVLLAAGALLWSRGKPHLKQFLFQRQLCLDWVLGADDTVEDPTKTADAFVSYAHQDHAKAACVVRGLERRGYTTVEHCRDWMPGAAVAEHIARSVLCARRTLLLVSDDYGASKWALEEFRTAHAHALECRSARVLLVRCGLRAPERLPPDLQLHLRLNTYLDYEDPAFWDKLCRVMPPLPAAPAAPAEPQPKGEKPSLVTRFVSQPTTRAAPAHALPGGKQPGLSEPLPLAGKQPRLWTPPAPRAAPIAYAPPRVLTPPPPRAAQTEAADQLARLLTPLRAPRPPPAAPTSPKPPKRSFAAQMELAPRATPAAPGAC